MTESEWAQKLIADNLYVIHLPTGMVGKVRAYHPAGAFISPVNNEPVSGEVIEFGTDDTKPPEHSFVINGELTQIEFMPLTPTQLRYYLQLEALMSHYIRESARLGKSMNLSRDVTADLMTAILVRQTRALQAPSNESKNSLGGEKH